MIQLSTHFYVLWNVWECKFALDFTFRCIPVSLGLFPRMYVSMCVVRGMLVRYFFVYVYVYVCIHMCVCV